LPAHVDGLLWLTRQCVEQDRGEAAITAPSNDKPSPIARQVAREW